MESTYVDSSIYCVLLGTHFRNPGEKFLANGRERMSEERQGVSAGTVRGKEERGGPCRSVSGRVERSFSWNFL